MADLAIMLVTLLGGLGMFLLGMKHLSEGLQATAGQGLRRFMAGATAHRIYGIGTGIVSTIIVQSSSITTVMLVGFVSTALMTLPQAFSVLIGANIGTTATVWIIAYAPDPQVVGLVGLALGGLLYFFCKGERPHNVGLTIIGLGLVFFGLYFMAKGVMPIKDNPACADLFHSLSAERVAGRILIAFAACALSCLIHSAAMVAIAMTLAAQGIIAYDVAIACLFGANVGTTVAGWLAAIGGTADARRTALAHTLSNLIGSIAFLPFFALFVKFGQTVFPNWNAPETMSLSGKEVVAYTHMMAPIAVTDTLFAICRGILFFPFVKPFCRFIEKLVKQPEDEKPHLSALNAGVAVSPVIACDHALQEVIFMRESCLDLLKCARAVVAGEADDKLESHIVHRENILDNVQKEVTEYLGSIMSKRLAQDVAERAQRLLRFTDELESVSDEAAAVLKAVNRLRKQGQSVSDVSRAALLSVHDRVAAFAEEISPWIRSPRPPVDVKAVQSESHDIHEFIRAARKAQLGRVGPEDPGSPIRVLAELDIINAYERVRSCYLNMAETVAGGKNK